MAVNYCKNIAQVTKKIAEFTKTKPDKVFWKIHCNSLMDSSDIYRKILYRDKNGSPVTVTIGYDGELWDVEINYVYLSADGLVR